MPKATLVYWYASSQLRLDGGGQRISAWRQALEALGFECEIIGLWSIGGGVSRGAVFSEAKRKLIPMPLQRRLPAKALDGDVVVATVPSVFGDAVNRVSYGRLILDWMDLWSVTARNLGGAGRFSRLGAWGQGRLWAGRERRFVSSVASNLFAGYSDFERMLGLTDGPAAWVPTPVPDRSSARKLGPIRTIGFLGNFDYPPNEISLRRFVCDYAGQLKENKWELVVGGYGSERIASWGFPVKVLGTVTSIEDFYAQLDAAVVPITHGGGIKVKAVEALSFDLPVFGTEHVRSGFGPEFQSLILPVERLRDPLEVDVGNRSTQTAFRKRFSQESFTESVAYELRRLGCVKDR